MTIDSTQPTGELLAAISNMVVGVYADCLGRGPTRARSYIDQDVVLCLLEDTLTKPERQLIASGNSAGALEIRTMLQKTMDEALAAGMEALLSRRVDAVVSGRQLQPDVVTAVFMLGDPIAGAAPGDPIRKPVLPQTEPAPGEGGTLRKE